MEIKSNYSMPKSNPRFGMAIHVTRELADKAPKFIDLINANAAEVNKLTPKNDVLAYLDSTQTNVAYIIRSKKGIIGVVDKFLLSVKAAFAEGIGDQSLMPQRAEALRLPVSKNALMNALNKIMK